MHSALVSGLAIVGMVSSASLAHADRGAGATLDFGYVRSRVGVTDATALDGGLGRFGLRISTNRNVHFGAEVDNGALAGHTSAPDGRVARTSGGEPLSGPLGGNSLAMRAYAGLHQAIGRVMLGGDGAIGFRDSSVSSDAGMDIAGRKKEPLVELRARAEVFVTDTMTLGAVASTDLLDRRNVSVAAVFSLNFTR